MVWSIRTKPVGRQKKEIALCAKSYCSTWYAGADYNERFIILIWIFQNSKWNQAAGLFSHLRISCNTHECTYMALKMLWLLLNVHKVLSDILLELVDFVIFHMDFWRALCHVSIEWNRKSRTYELLKCQKHSNKRHIHQKG